MDIGSRLDGFVAHLLVFMPVTSIDVRPLRSTVQGLSFLEEDATTLRSIADASVESISSLHAVEHFGLGRYGDPVDPEGPFKMMRSLTRVLKPGGRLYFSVPVGQERLEFNAHRVFSPRTILDAFAGLRLLSFAAVDDAGELRDPCTPDQVEDADYACGLFELTST
jgi:SAM-dependent methyltransferase